MGWLGVLFLTTNFLPSSIMLALNAVLTSGIEYAHGIHFMNNFILIIVTYNSLALAGADFTTISQVFAAALPQFMILGVPTVLCLIYHFGTIAVSNYYKKLGIKNTKLWNERKNDDYLKYAIKAYKKSAWLGNSNAMFELAKLYQYKSAFSYHLFAHLSWNDSLTCEFVDQVM